MKYLLALLLAACQTPQPQAPAPQFDPVTVTDAAHATFRVNGSDGSMGTGWVVKHRDLLGYTETILITAGHVCDVEVEEVEEDEAVYFTVTSPSGEEYPVDLLKRHATYDLCALTYWGALGVPLAISALAPTYDEPVAFVGAPNGVYGCDYGGTVPGCGMAPISRGYFAGGNLVSMPSTGGASGSAVFTQYGVIGVLVEGYRVFDSLTFIEPLPHLNEFLYGI